MPRLLVIGAAAPVPGFEMTRVVSVRSAGTLTSVPGIDCLLAGPLEFAAARSTLEGLRTHATLSEAPVVVVLRDGDEVQAAALLQAGAADCLFEGESTRSIERALLLAVTRGAQQRAQAAADESSRSLIALHARQRRLETVIQHVPAYVYVLDLSGRYELVNRAYEDLVGIPGGELQGKSLFDVFPAEEAAQLFANNRAVVESDAPHEFEETATIGGEDRLFTSIKALLRDEHGVPVAIVGVSWDVTERRRAVRAIRESETRLRLALDTGAMGTVTHWLEEDVLQLDGMAQQVLWIEGERLPFATFLLRLHVDDRDRVADIVRSSLDPSGAQRSDLEFRIVLNDGRIRWIYERFVVLFEGEGATRIPTQTLATVQDVTARRDREDALREALAAKDAFLGMVSHELRTPLTMIAANAEFLRRTRDGVSETVDEIVANVDRLSRVIDNMLAIARVEQGRGPAPELTLVSRLVGGAVARHQRAHPDRAVTVTEDAEAVVVLCVPDYLDLIVSNLLSNAQRHTAGPIGIAIRRFPDRIEVHVLDEGPGIDTVRANRLFAPFFELERENRSEGLGLGLSVCKRLVGSQNGQIWVSARSGGGSDFAVSLPTALAAAAIPLMPTD
jgi:PAS domain S-box-containing protein